MAATRRWICRCRNSRGACAAKSRPTRTSSKRRALSRSKQALQGNSGQSLEFLEAQTVDGLDDVQAVGLHVDHREIRVDAVDTARAGERIGAALDDLAFTLLRQVLHHHQHLL